jgi:hypothetical protein
MAGVESFLSSELQNLLSGMGKLTEMAREVNSEHKCTAPDCQLEIMCILPLNGTSPLQGVSPYILSVATFISLQSSLLQPTDADPDLGLGRLAQLRASFSKVDLESCCIGVL